MSLLVWLVPSAAAQQSSPSEWGGGGADAEGLDEVHSHVERGHEGATGTKRRTAHDRWVRLRGACVEDPGESQWVGELPPDSERFLIAPGTQTQALYQHVRIDPDGTVHYLEQECRPFPGQRASQRPSEQRRDALTARVEEWLRVPAPTIAMSPQGTEEHPGLTGLESMLWTEGIGLWAPPPTTLGGTQVEVQAWPVEYRWDTGDGAPQPGSAAPSEHAYVFPCSGGEQEPTIAGSCGGSRTQPQAVHVYETKSSVGAPGKGVYTVTVQVVWRARYRVLRAAGPGPWTALPERQTEASRPYRVQEVRSALVP